MIIRSFWTKRAHIWNRCDVTAFDFYTGYNTSIYTSGERPPHSSNPYHLHQILVKKESGLLHFKPSQKSSVVYMKHKEHHCKKSILLQNWCTIHFQCLNFSKLISISITEGKHCIEMWDLQLWMLTYDIRVHSSFLQMKFRD